MPCYLMVVTGTAMAKPTFDDGLVDPAVGDLPITTHRRRTPYEVVILGYGGPEQ